MAAIARPSETLAGRRCAVPVAIAGLIALAVFASACGSRSSTEESIDAGAGGGDGARAAWSAQVLGQVAPDGGIASATGEVAVIVSIGADGFTAWFDNGDIFEPAAVEDQTTRPTEAQSVAAVAVVADGYLAAVNDYELFEPQLWHSTDGTSWRRLQTSGLTGPADVAIIAVHGDTVLIGGAGRGGSDPNSGPFSPVIWRSEDLETWDEAEVENAPDGAVAMIIGDDLGADGLLALGPSSSGSTAWRSTDSGATWQIGALPDFGPGVRYAEVNGVASHDGTLMSVGRLASEGGDSMLLARSSDGGSTWASADLSGAGTGGHSVVHSLDGWWAASSRFIGVWEDPDACYIDLEGCTGGSESLLLYSEDAETWDNVDLAALELADHGRLDRVLDRGDSMSVIGIGEELTVWTFHPDQSDPDQEQSNRAPQLLAPPESRPELELELALVTWDADLEIGRTYRFPLNLHCGMDYLANFNGSHWYLKSTPEGAVETGAGQPPESDWPVAQETIFGFVTLLDADTISYTIGNNDSNTDSDTERSSDGRQIAIYGPSDTEPPGCG